MQDFGIKRKGDFYTHFFYWIDGGEFEKLRGANAELPRFMKITGVPCKAIHPDAGAAFVAPEEWNKVCYRQGAWYRVSSKAGRTLVVTEERYSALEPFLSGVIRPSEFQTGKGADDAEIRHLSSLLNESGREPGDWRDVQHRELVMWRRFLERMGVEGELPDLIDIHTANHANFIFPVIFNEENGSCVPYSIAPSEKVCSACVELFNILGEEFPRKLVLPCPGAVCFAKMIPNRFMEVLSGGLMSI